MEVNKCKAKLKLLFDKFFEENFELSSYYSENLIKYLDGCDDKYAAKLLDTPFFSDLIVHSLTNLENISISVRIFILEVFTVAIKNELQFSKLTDQQGFKMLVEKLLMKSLKAPIALQIAGLRNVTAHTCHYSGIMTLVETKVWTRVLIPDVHQRAPKVAQGAYNFISTLVWKLNEYDEEAALIEILGHVVHPIQTSNYICIEVIDDDNEKSLYEPLFSYMNALLTILKDYEKNTGQNKVLQLLYRHFVIEGPLHMILQSTRNSDLVSLINDCLFYFMLAMSKDYLCSGLQGDRDIATELISEYYNMINVLINKRVTSAVVIYVVKCVTIWAKIDSSPFPATFERHGRTFNLQNQFIALVLIPLLTYTVHLGTVRNNRELLEAIEVYCIKLNKMNSEPIIKAKYSLRALIESGDIKKTVILCLREIFKLKSCLNVAQAGMLYQALFYTLKLHVVTDGSGALILNENPLKTPDDVKLLTLVLEAIRMLLTEHDINWYENVEIISLQTTLMDLLKLNCMPTKQLLQTIHLIDLSIKKFLSPDMALLMESKRGSTLDEIGALMKSYMQHEEWEIRDSALHLLLSCTEVAFVKYFPLRKLMLEKGLVILATHAALHDEEVYVQTTALRCLAAATKIESIWREILITHSSLLTQLISILLHNSEGIIRKEAANVLTEIYVNQKLHKDIYSFLFNAMVTVGINDLHWEVQIAALNFWKNVIQNLMSNRGMIDGKFPSVTFSKQRRKIIILNQKEIMNQLVAFVNELSFIGCLNVLSECLKEDCNIHVMEQAYCIATNLVKILDYYKFEGVPNDNTTPTKDTSYVKGEDVSQQDIIENFEEALDLSIAPPRDQIELREKIIETIVNTTDYDLIVACYEKHMQVSSDDMDEDIEAPSITKIEPNTFLKRFRNIDYVSVIKDKKTWISGPHSLDMILDEVLALKMKTDIIEECN